ncbi:MAG: hypothetical protein ACK45V_01705 [Brevundimonas sp.]
MPVTLPTSPAPASIAIGLISARNELSPAFGGPVQRLNRKGSRWRATVSLPAMTYAEALAWTDLRVEADTVVLDVPQPGLEIGTPGTPLVKGAGQLGASLLIDGLTVGYVVRKGQFLSVVTGSQRYLYQATAAVTANGSGEATVAIRPMLRVSPADNAVVEIAAPKIEGFVRTPPSFDVNPAFHVVLGFDIEERA